MGFLDSITKSFVNIPILNQISNVANLVQSIAKGDLGGILNAASQLALTYATGGMGPLMQAAASMVTELAMSQIGGGAGAGGLGSQQLGIGGAADYMSKALTGALGVEAGLAAIQLLGQQQGLPQSAIDAAQGAFAEQMGDRSEAREQYAEAGMYKKGSLFRRTDRVTGTEREQANAFLDVIKNNAAQNAPFGPMIGAPMAGPNAGLAQLGAARRRARSTASRTSSTTSPRRCSAR